MTAAPGGRGFGGWGGALLIVVLLALLGVSVFGLVDGWTRVDAPLGFHGWVAILGGGAIAIALGAGLMALSFHSARAGYDDRAQPPPDDDPQ